MTGDELRASFLEYFEGKGHKVIPSSSLIPHGDPTLLLTSAGMVQFKPYFLGDAKPPSRRLTSVQKCFRTTDIESVGDSGHLTFFEMLGNFSVGDYFKKEAIAFAWEFVTEKLMLPVECLWITVYRDDDEAASLWRQQGVRAERILRFGEKENFWGPAGDSGPCGPCSEIHYDFGADVGCGKPGCDPACGCGRFSEVWNLVFMQFNQDKDGKRTPLPRPNIDTGMGLERITAVTSGVDNVYQTDIFAPLIREVEALSGRKYSADAETDRAIRVVAEHSRGITFLITDGVIPGKEGRGYVLRRLLRRAAVFGRRLGLTRPFLSQMVMSVVEAMGHAYHELEQRQDFVLDVVQNEESRFNDTVITGLELLDNMMQGSRKVSGQQAFKLYDTYGLPIELTAEIAAGRGLSVDMEGFEREMEAQREKARAAHRFELGDRTHIEKVIGLEATCFVGYENLKESTVIAGIIAGGEPISSIEEGQEAGIILEKTPFYAEMGGQVGDSGRIEGEGSRFDVGNTITLENGVIIHRGRVTGGTVAVGDAVSASVDEERRRDIAGNHTATHLLQYALRRVLGEHVQQRGSVVAADHLRFDFSHLKPLTPDELKQVERLVNREIRRNLPVYDEEMTFKQATAQGVTALFGEKYGETVRALKIGKPPVSAELCGGTHVQAAGEIGLFRIKSESGIGTGLRRIEAVTGRGAEEEISKMFESQADEIARLGDELDKERKRVQWLEKEMARGEAESLAGRVIQVNGVNVLASRVAAASIDNLREMSDRLRDKIGSLVLVLGAISQGKPVFLSAVTPDLVDKGFHAGKIIKEVAAIAGGSGGGKPNLAQGGGRDPQKLDEALKAVTRLIENKSI